MVRPYRDPETAKQVVATKKHWEDAYRVHQQSVVLLKNKEGLIPLDRAVSYTHLSENMWETWRCGRKNSRPYTPMEDDALYSVGVIFLYFLKHLLK